MNRIRTRRTGRHTTAMSAMIDVLQAFRYNLRSIIAQWMCRRRAFVVPRALYDLPLSLRLLTASDGYQALSQQS